MSSDTSSQPPDPSDVSGSGAEISGSYGASYHSALYRAKQDPDSSHGDSEEVAVTSQPSLVVPTKSAKFALGQSGTGIGVHTILESPRLDEKEGVEEWMDVEEGVKKRSRDAGI